MAFALKVTQKSTRLTTCGAHFATIFPILGGQESQPATANRGQVEGERLVYLNTPNYALIKLSHVLLFLYSSLVKLGFGFFCYSIFFSKLVIILLLKLESWFSGQRTKIK